MRDRRSFSALVGGGLLLVLFWPATSGAPAPPLAQPTSPGEERLDVLAELALRSRGDHDGFGLFPERPLAALASDRAQSFTLFRDRAGDTSRRRLLANIPYGDLIEDAAERHRVDSLLLAAVVQAESGFDPTAVSPRGAQGLMQLMPVTAQSYGALEPHEPSSNVRAGARYLRDLMRRFDDDLELTLAAYNAGPAAVRRFRGVPPYRETRQYVQRVLTLYLGYHRAMWQQAELDQLMGALPQAASLPPVLAAARGRSAAGRAVAIGALGALPATQPLAKVADALAQPLAELRQAGVSEDQQHDGEDDQQLRDTEASEHEFLRSGGSRGTSLESLWTGSRTASRVLGFSLADRPAPLPTPAAAPSAPPVAPAPH